MSKGIDFEYKDAKLTLENTIVDGELKRVVIKEGGLGFPYLNYEQAAEDLVENYGGEKEEALVVLNKIAPLDGVTVPDVASTVAPSEIKTDVKTGTSKGKGKGRRGRKPKADGDKPAVAKEKPEPVKITFNLPEGAVTRTVQVKTVLPDQKPETTEDVKLTDTVGLHIDRYSKRNRTALLYLFKNEDGAPTPIVSRGINEENPHEVDLIGNYDEVRGKVLIEKVSLMDAIYKFAEVEGMSFGQADKFIKIKRGLLPVPEKKDKSKNAVDLTKVGKDKKKSEKKEKVVEAKEV